jgi:hypothetical protein
MGTPYTPYICNPLRAYGSASGCTSSQHHDIDWKSCTVSGAGCFWNDGTEYYGNNWAWRYCQVDGDYKNDLAGSTSQDKTAWLNC